VLINTAFEEFNILLEIIVVPLTIITSGFNLLIVSIVFFEFTFPTLITLSSGIDVFINLSQTYGEFTFDDKQTHHEVSFGLSDLIPWGRCPKL
jgi:hypothetical protein